MNELPSEEAALLAIARNAVALWNDATLLFKHGRFARAASLAVLAGEEAGKFWLAKWKPDGCERQFNEHGSKLAVGAAFHAIESAGILIGSTGDLHDNYTAAIDDPHYAAWVSRAKALGQIKLAGLYVDLDDSGMSEPHVFVNEVTAASCLGFATGEVQRLYAAEIVRRNLPPLGDLPSMPNRRPGAG